MMEIASSRACFSQWKCRVRLPNPPAPSLSARPSLGKGVTRLLLSPLPQCGRGAGGEVVSKREEGRGVEGTRTARRPAIRVAQVMRPAAGGMRRHLFTLLAGLDRRRFAPTLFAPADFPAADCPSDVPHIPLAISARTRPLADLHAIRQLAQHLRQNFDIVHAHGLRGALIGVLAARQAGLPALFTAHNLISRPSLLQRFFLALVGRDAAAVIAVSEAVAAMLCAAGIPRAKIAVIPNGIALGPFDVQTDAEAVRAAFGVPPTAPLVLAIGRLSPEKGFDVLLEAFRQMQLRMPEARLILAGSGPEEAALWNQAVRGGIDQTGTVIFAGQQAEVAPLLQAADVVAIPSRQEGQGIVALEAMAARRPVVASRVGGLVETVIEGETGLLVPPQDAAALAEALLALLSNPAQRQQMGEAGRVRVTQEYTAERMVQRIEAVYAGLVHRTREPEGTSLSG